MLFKSLKIAAISSLCLIFALASPEAKEVTLTGPKGLGLSANLELAEGQTLADPVVLLTHGTLAHNKMEIMVALQTALAERGISSLAPTLSLGVDKRTRMYDCAVPHTHKHSDALIEIGLWQGWLKDQGTTNVVLAGHSRGGNQTAWFAARHPDAVVSKVILIAPATWSADTAAEDFKKRHNRELAGALAEAEALVAAGKGELMIKGMGVLYCPGADVTAASFVDYYQPDDRMHTPNLLGMIGKPTLVIAASEDTVSKGLIEATRPLADAGTVELVVIEDAGHFFLDFYAEDAADAIQTFIQSP